MLANIFDTRVLLKLSRLLFPAKDGKLPQFYFQQILKYGFPVLFILGVFSPGSCQNVGIGTVSPHPVALLDLNSTSSVLLLPRMNNQQMNAIDNPPVGSLIFNTQQQQFMGYVRSYNSTLLVGGNIIVRPTNQWVPVSTGPRMLAWGIVDTIQGGALVRNGSENFSIVWNGYKFSSENEPSGTLNQYEISLTGNTVFNIDSMMVHVTPIGSNSWDQTPSVWFTNDGKILIKFADVSREAQGTFNETTKRRRSRFSFAVYDLRKVAL